MMGDLSNAQTAAEFFSFNHLLTSIMSKKQFVNWSVGSSQTWGGEFQKFCFHLTASLPTFYSAHNMSVGSGLVLIPKWHLKVLVIYVTDLNDASFPKIFCFSFYILVAYITELVRATSISNFETTH